MELTNLMLAAQKNDVQGVKQCLNECGKLYDDMTALMMAIEKGNTECVALLEQHERNVFNSCGVTPLIVALHFEQFACVEIFRDQWEIATQKQWKSLFPGTTAQMMAKKAASPNIRALSFSGLTTSCQDPVRAGVQASRNGSVMPQEERTTSSTFNRKDHEVLCQNYLKAAQTGNYRFIRENSMFITALDEKKRTALILATKEGHLDCIRFLASSLSGKVDAEGNAAIFYALKNKNHEAIKVLAQKEHQVISACGLTPLMEAVLLGDLDAVKIMSPHMAKGVTKKPLALDGPITPLPEASTALMLAICCNQTEIALHLAPLEVGKKNNRGYTALMYAAIVGNVRLAQELSKELKTINREQETAFSLALRHNNHGCLPYLKGEGYLLLKEKKTVIQQLIAENKMSIAKDALTAIGPTPLAAAIDLKEDACVRSLLLQEKRITEKQFANMGITNLMLAQMVREPKAIHYFSTEAGRVDRNGSTALMRAVHENDRDGVQCLLQYEGGLTGSRGLTALMVAAMSGSEQLIPLLLEKECGLTDISGCTALMYAIIHNRKDCAKYFHQEIGKVTTSPINVIFENETIVLSKGVSALMLAVIYKVNDVIPSLAPGEAALKDENNQTAYDYSVTYKNGPAMAILANSSPRPKEQGSGSKHTCTDLGSPTKRSVKFSDQETPIPEATLKPLGNNSLKSKRKPSSIPGNVKSSLPSEVAESVTSEPASKKDIMDILTSLNANFVRLFDQLDTYGIKGTPKKDLPVKECEIPTLENKLSELSANHKATLEELKSTQSKVQTLTVERDTLHQELSVFQGTAPLNKYSYPDVIALNQTLLAAIGNVNMHLARRDVLLCVVCNKNPRTLLLKPCTHFCICDTCRDARTTATCPICEMPFTSCISGHLEL
ncbi:Ankyrin repeat protein 2 [Giardia muris]|uniref:Ankyrin repeat protein 2 n=1 Tax=Giardia muris TaxID=5742 RepID=A0A4Z1TA78_GIAMU|nr:Ankyrin repeat protein 2 [Giardia muris]|eukprot:TNJ30137.1 Ankyrin repeat protein 2 [Giardia muris]